MTTYNGSGRKALIDQKIRKSVGHALRLNEDKGQAACMSMEDIEQDRAFIVVFNIFDFLGNVLRG